MMGLLSVLIQPGCSRGVPFSEYERNFFPETPVTTSSTKVIKLQNPHATEPQHIRAIDFDAGGNVDGHFLIEQATVGGRPVETRDVQIPPGGNLSLHVTYHPTNLATSAANFGGIETGAEQRFTPHAPVVEDERREQSASDAQTAMLGGGDTPAYNEAVDVVHRGLMVLTYDHPEEGVMRIELVGAAVPGPNGEMVADALVPATGASKCPDGEDRSCFVGEIGLAIPDLLDAEFTTELQGPWLLDVSDGTAEVPMKDFPIAIFLVEGGGLPTISIVISGDEATEAVGSYTDDALSVTNASFRVRVIMGSVSLSSLNSASPLADFMIRDVELVASEPDDDANSHMLTAEVVLADAPSGNPLVDSKLGGVRIVVRLRGELTVP